MIFGEENALRFPFSFYIIIFNEMNFKGKLILIIIEHLSINMKMLLIREREKKTGQALDTTG